MGERAPRCAALSSTDGADASACATGGRRRATLWRAAVGPAAADDGRTQDVQGADWSILEALLEADAELLCAISYVFIEFHGSAAEIQRAKLPSYGIAADAFEALKARVHAAMERPGCRLQIYWRSFWASCGDKQRFEWRDGAQVTAT